MAARAKDLRAQIVAFKAAAESSWWFLCDQTTHVASSS
jgi:hypothetical protein